jgi:DNA-binding transcriptional MerR regulator
MTVATTPSVPLKIGELAERTGTTAPTIRYYEEIGLLPTPTRQGGGQRRYGEDAVRRLTFVRRLREFGFTIEQVRELVALSEDAERDCVAARDIGQAHLDAIRARLTELRALEREMTAFVQRCETACAGGPGTACVPLVALRLTGAAGAGVTAR